MTVPATLLSAISFAKFGPLSTPMSLEIWLEITSDNKRKGFERIPFVHEIT